MIRFAVPGWDGDQAVAASNRDIAVEPERERESAGTGDSQHIFLIFFIYFYFFLLTVNLVRFPNPLDFHDKCAHML